MVAFIHWKHYISCCHLSLCLTLTELPVLGDHLAVATVALTGVGAVAVHAAAPPFTGVLVTLVYIYEGGQRKDVKTEKESIRGRMRHDIAVPFHQQRLYTFQDLTLELLYYTGIPQ